jgi:hypothetical protein
MQILDLGHSVPLKVWRILRGLRVAAWIGMAAAIVVLAIGLILFVTFLSLLGALLTAAVLALAYRSRLILFIPAFVAAGFYLRFLDRLYLRYGEMKALGLQEGGAGPGVRLA